MPRGRPRERWLSGQSFENWLDEVVQQAEAAGQFANLPGHGKPLPEADPYESLDEWALAHRMLHRAGFLPDWLEARKEIAAERPAVVAALEDYRRERARLVPGDPTQAATVDRLAERYAALATAINRKIDEHNLRRPGGIPDLVRFREDLADDGRTTNG